MTLETFEYLWEQGIKKAVKHVKEEIDSDAECENKVEFDDSDEMCKKLYHRYGEIRSYVRENYFNRGNNDENKMDGHKICACITAALLDVRIAKLDLSGNEIPSSVIAYSNYTIAFLSAIYIMYLFLLSDYEKEKKTKCYNKLIEQSKFEFPETNYGHDSYVQGRIKTLALNDINGVDFDILTYADMLFWIEKYNKDLIMESVKQDEEKQNKESKETKTF